MSLVDDTVDDVIESLFTINCSVDEDVGKRLSDME